ncbi:hypothetical protein F4553_001377 [Allocatelliglobosispora scoriae]|uniref:DUF5648 domain-containing protein n=1 Tax=Allocatelliglobosispora scoriae TaxID=643052 RepID=A0A841BKV6_9ACTN|nr:hypothetical protein [Allocatelliglobosispora scoriae]MBB5867998.1 hypothetical protein [Allocatelliglobosispora scoriae]
MPRRTSSVRRLAIVTVLATVATTLLPIEAALAAQGGEAVVAKILWRVRVGSRPDLMTTKDNAERDGFPNDGQIYYLPATQVANTRPLYRLYNPNAYGHMDHMESLTPGEGGYQTEAPVGYAYQAAGNAQGLSQYRRTFNGCNGDHGSRSVNEPALSCYADEPLAGAFGWPRFANTASSPLTLSGGGVTVESNLAAGGAVFQWTHNGVQYLNRRDYGRELQSSVFFDRGNHVQSNPTEAGDTWTDWDRPAWARHGSPLASASNNTATLTQSTRSVPIEFLPQTYAGGGPDNPVIYKDMLLGKDITLNWGGLGPVARYTTVLTSPALTGEPTVEIPTGYLRAEFTRFFTYDAISQTIQEINQSPNCPDSYNYYHYTPPNRGGVIIANSSLTAAMGVYGANKSVGGSVSEMLLGNFFSNPTACGGGTGDHDFATSKWSVIHKGNLGAGTKTFNTYVMTGSVGNIKTYMNQLAAWGNA